MDISAAYEGFRKLSTPSEMVDVFNQDVSVSSTKNEYKDLMDKLRISLEGYNAHEAVAIALALLQAKSWGIHDEA